MSSEPTQFATSRMMGIYDSTHHVVSTWNESFNADGAGNSNLSPDFETDANLDDNNNNNNGLQDTSPDAASPSKSYEERANNKGDKVQRRLAQNREAARKSRLRKKAYIQQLESSKIKLAQLEQEAQHARKQGVYIGGQTGESTLGLTASSSSGIAAFEIEYTHWIEEQIKKTGELRAGLQARVSDIELRILVEGVLSHYDNLFKIKSIVAKTDVFYLMSGMWKTPSERFFLWISGFRPSELIKILLPQMEPLTEKQAEEVYSLQQSCVQTEDALSQGMDKLNSSLSLTLINSSSFVRGGGGDYLDVSSCVPEMSTALSKLDSLVSFVNQADLLRQQTLQQMHKILTTRQAARALLSLADFLQRLRALSSLWAARPRDPT